MKTIANKIDERTSKTWMNWNMSWSLGINPAQSDDQMESDESKCANRMFEKSIAACEIEKSV